jgi:hypothetical protein
MAKFFNTSPCEIEQMDFATFKDSIEFMNKTNIQEQKRLN